MNTRIKLIRKKNNLTQDEFGKKIGLTKSGISNIEKGLRGVTNQVFLSICREFNVNENWLRTGKGEIFNYSKEDTLIEKISAEYKLDSFQKKLVQSYLKLTDKQKATVKSFLDKIYEDEFANSQFSETINDDLATTEENSETLAEPESIPSEYANMPPEELIKQANMLEALIEKKQMSLASQKQSDNLKNAGSA